MLQTFFVRPARPRDLEQCYCQKCITVHKEFQALITYRRSKKCGCPIYENVYDFLRAKLCPKKIYEDDKDENEKYHEMKCIHKLQHGFLFSDWLFSKYAECIENVHCTPRTVPRLHPHCARCFWCVIARANITSTDPFFSLGKVVNILHV